MQIAYLVAVGEVGQECNRGNMRFIELTKELVVTAGAYSANDVVGGLIQFENIFCPSDFAKLRGVALTDRSNNSVRYDLVFFSAAPTGAYANDAAVGPSNGDLLLMSPVVALTTSDLFSFGTKGAVALTNFELPLKLAKPNSRDSGRTVWCALVTRGTPTYASTSDLALKLILEV